MNTDKTTPEKDPHGIPQHSPGAKLDAGKPRPSLVLHGFADAIAEVIAVAEYGAKKYTPMGWREVRDGQARYTEAKLRHQMAAARGELIDPATGLRHAAQEAWNALAALQLQLEQEEQAKQLERAEGRNLGQELEQLFEAAVRICKCEECTAKRAAS